MAKNGMLSSEMNTLFESTPDTVKLRELLVATSVTTRRMKSAETVRQKSRVTWDARLSNSMILFDIRIKKRAPRLSIVMSPAGQPERVSRAYPSMKARNQLPREGQ